MIMLKEKDTFLLIKHNYFLFSNRNLVIYCKVVHAVGLMWYSNQTVLINIGTILNCEKELLDDGTIYDWELDDDINAGICKTLVHEIRHLAVANPFLPEEFLGKTVADDEIDAEEYAEKICSNGVPYIIQKTDKEIEIYENDEPEI